MQTTTRGEALDAIKPGEKFQVDDIDFGRAIAHIQIHQDGRVAGSQFNQELFADGTAVAESVKMLLKQVEANKELTYDQFGRAEITLRLKTDQELPVGWSGIRSIKGLPSDQISREIRIEGGVAATEDGIEGAWYPEMAYNPAAGKMEIVKNDDGSPKNLHGKFEPMANIVHGGAAQTDQLTLIIQKDKDSGKPVVLTIFPGENAPMFPAKIQSESYKADSIGDTKETKYWNEHAFIRD